MLVITIKVLAKPIVGESEGSTLLQKLVDHWSIITDDFDLLLTGSRSPLEFETDQIRINLEEIKATNGPEVQILVQVLSTEASDAERHELAGVLSQDLADLIDHLLPWGNELTIIGIPVGTS